MIVPAWFFNIDGFIGQKHDNGLDIGDPNKTFFYYIAQNILWPENFSQNKQAVIDCLEKIEIDPGIYVRSKSDGVSWHADPLEFSRDQQTSLIVLMGVYKLKTKLLNLLTRHIRRGGKYQNKDFSVIFIDENWALYWRSLGWWFMWPLLLIADFHLFISVFVRLFQTENDADDVGDCLNLQLKLRIPQILGLGTPLSWIARITYNTLRNGPQDYSPKLVNYPVIGWQWPWVWYFRPEIGAPPIDKIVIPAFEKLDS